MLAAAIKDRFSRVWTYRWSMTHDGRRYDVRLESRWTCNTFVVDSSGETLGREVLHFYHEPFRLQELVVEGGSGRQLAFRTAPRNLYSYGLEVVDGGSAVYRSHPEPFAGLKTIEKISSFGQSASSAAGQAGRGTGQTGGNPVFPAIATDICVSVLLYNAAGYMSLRDVAILGAAVFLLLMLVDWSSERLLSRKLNLTGGLSALAIVMLLLSAGFAWLVENELAVMLKSSALGLIASVMLAVDAMLGGKYVGKRVSQLITFMQVDPRRFSWGSAMAGAGQSLLSAAIAIWLSRDAWLLYKHWIAPVLGIALGVLVLLSARRHHAPQADEIATAPAGRG